MKKTINILLIALNIFGSPLFAMDKSELAPSSNEESSGETLLGKLKRCAFDPSQLIVPGDYLWCRAYPIHFLMKVEPSPQDLALVERKEAFFRTLYRLFLVGGDSLITELDRDKKTALIIAWEQLQATQAKAATIADNKEFVYYTNKIAFYKQVIALLENQLAAALHGTPHITELISQYALSLPTITTRKLISRIACYASMNVVAQILERPYVKDLLNPILPTDECPLHTLLARDWERDRVEVLKLLLQAGSSPNALCCGHTGLHRLIAHGYDPDKSPSAMEDLRYEFIDLEKENMRETFLAMADALLQHADLTITNKYGKTALQAAQTRLGQLRFHKNIISQSAKIAVIYEELIRKIKKKLASTSIINFD